MGTARLVTASATTGWTDWVHGQLWLLDEGLLRIAGALAQTLAHGSGPTVPDGRIITTPLSPSEAEQHARHRRNVWVPRQAISSAVLRGGWLTDSIVLELVDGEVVKFLWMRHDRAYAPLRRALQSWLGPALEIRGRSRLPDDP